MDRKMRASYKIKKCNTHLSRNLSWASSTTLHHSDCERMERLQEDVRGWERIGEPLVVAGFLFSSEASDGRTVYCSYDIEKT